MGEVNKEFQMIDVSRLSDPFKFIKKLGSKFECDFLILDIRPLNSFTKEEVKLVELEILNSRYQKDYELGVLMESSQGHKVMGMIRYKQFRKLNLIPEVGYKYRVSLVVERFFRNLFSTDLVFLGCRIIDLKN